MAKGERYPAEWRTYTDPHTGATSKQLTAYKGHSHHLYFTNPGWYDGGRKLLFGSKRPEAHGCTCACAPPTLRCHSRSWSMVHRSTMHPLVRPGRNWSYRCQHLTPHHLSSSSTHR